MSDPFPLVRFAVPAAVLAACLLAGGAVAAVQAPQTVAVFLKLEGIAGDSSDPAHKGEIEVQSFSLAAQRQDDGKAKFNDFFVLKVLDGASPQLLAALASGRTIPTAVLTVRGKLAGDNEPREYLRYTFSDLSVTRLNQVVSGGGQEELNLRYGQVKVEYTGPDGKTVEGGNATGDTPAAEAKK